MRQPDSNTDFEVSFHDGYIHVNLAENYEINAAGLEKIWTAVAHACREYDCHYVLSEGKIHSRKLTLWDTYVSGIQASEIPSLRHACLIYDFKPDEITEFFKDVLTNRGSYIEFFNDKKKALEWLGVIKNI